MLDSHLQLLQLYSSGIAEHSSHKSSPTRYVGTSTHCPSNTARCQCPASTGLLSLHPASYPCTRPPVPAPGLCLCTRPHRLPRASQGIYYTGKTARILNLLSQGPVLSKAQCIAIKTFDDFHPQITLNYVIMYLKRHYFWNSFMFSISFSTHLTHSSCEGFGCELSITK